MNFDESLVKNYVSNYFADHKELAQKLHYHSLQHTLKVVSYVKEIASESNCIEKEINELILAAYFHDLGYLNNRENHEEASVAIMKEYVSQNNLQIDIDLIEKLILATKLTKEPNTKLEKIIKDADCLHIVKVSYDEFLKQSELVRKEWKAFGIKKSKKEWLKETLAFLKTLKHYSSYTQKTYTTNLQEIIQKLENEFPEDKKQVKSKGVETVFRVSLRNHMTLSGIADNKANTLLSVNAIIISIVLSTLFPKLDNNSYLYFPSLSLLATSLITIIICVLSTLPKTTTGFVNKEEVKTNKGNLLFFGNFHKMPLKDYEWSMNQLMMDEDYLYNSLTRDLYFLGKVLNRKYKILRLAYYAFIIGLVISIILFLTSIYGVV